MHIAKSQEGFHDILPEMSNRHGLITGATGSGKTVSIKVLSEAFSRIGVPVFVQDVKGDLSGFVRKGEPGEKFLAHLAQYGGEEPEYDSFPTVFWDIFGEKGHSLRTTISQMGPMMLSRLLQLNDTQTGIVYAIFKIADDRGWLLLDLKDFTAMLDHVYMEREQYEREYGAIPGQSVATVKRKLSMLEADGLGPLFGEPALDIRDLMLTAPDGRGCINILNADRISRSPSVYAGFLLWLLSELFEELPEVGDPDKPKLVFFFDEAHLIFKDMPSYLMEKVEQVIKLIRSKGVGIFFVTQNPADIPEAVLSQLGNRIQHVLRAYTPNEQKAVRTAASSFRSNPAFDTAEAITQLAVGEALVSFLDEHGVPGMVERAWILPPASSFGPCTESEMMDAITGDGIGSRYDDEVDRESAYEMLKRKAEEFKEAEDARLMEEQRLKEAKERERELEAAKKQAAKEAVQAGRASRRDSAMDRAVKSAASAIGYNVGRQIIRGVLGSFTGGKK